jgi:hypothetical protein
MNLQPGCRKPHRNNRLKGLSKEKKKFLLLGSKGSARAGLGLAGVPLACCGRGANVPHRSLLHNCSPALPISSLGFHKTPDWPLAEDRELIQERTLHLSSNP